MERSVNLIIIFLFLVPSAKAQFRGNEQKPSTEQMATETIDQLSKKVSLTQLKKDSAVMIFVEFFNNIETYRVSNNENGVKIIQYFEEARDSIIKRLFDDEKKYKIYIAFIFDLKAEQEKRGNPDGGWGGDRPQNGYSKERPPKGF
jgi:hypothetical protein